MAIDDDKCQLDISLASVDRNPRNIIKALLFLFGGGKTSTDLDHGAQSVGFFHLNPVLGPITGTKGPVLVDQYKVKVSTFQNLGTIGEVVAPILIHPDLIQQLI